MENKRKNNIETDIVHGCNYFDGPTGAITTPIYLSSTFRHPGLESTTGYKYSRVSNPTRNELECTIAKLESAKHGLAFSSGVAAISTVLKLFKPGDHIISTDDLYGGTYQLFEVIYKKYGIEVTYVDFRNLDDIKNAIKTNTKAFFFENPTNPMMKVIDIISVVEIAKRHNLLTIADNTFLTPYFQRPIELGVNIVVHSATKYLGGHNDTLAGLMVLNDDGMAEELRLLKKMEGGVLSPFDTFLILRGIKTLAVRLEKQQKNAFDIAEFLCRHEKVEKVYFTGMQTHPGHDILKRQASGFGSMISFTLKDKKYVAPLLERLKIIFYAESLGGVESLITYPMIQTHWEIPEDMRNKLGITDRLIRLSVGIENVEDLIEDLRNALC